MAKRSPSSVDSEVRVSPEEKIARLLAVMITKDQEQVDQVSQLLSIGFAVADIAAILELSPNHVSVAKYAAKKKAAGKGRKRT